MFINTSSYASNFNLKMKRKLWLEEKSSKEQFPLDIIRQKIMMKKHRNE
jgi:hypothetical protein